MHAPRCPGNFASRHHRPVAANGGQWVDCPLDLDQPLPRFHRPATAYVVTWGEEVGHRTSVGVSSHSIVYPGEGGGDRLCQFRHREYAQGKQDVGLIKVPGGSVPRFAVRKRTAEMADLQRRQW